MQHVLTGPAAAAAIACIATPALPADDDARAAIEERNAAFEQAYNSGDAAALAALYTEDGSIFPPGGARQDGREAIASFWSGAIESGLADLDLSTVEMHGSGDAITEIGGFTATAPAAEGSGRTELAGKYVVLWTRGSDGTWRLHRDIWNLQ